MMESNQLEEQGKGEYDYKCRHGPVYSQTGPSGASNNCFTFPI